MQAKSRGSPRQHWLSASAALSAASRSVCLDPHAEGPTGSSWRIDLAANRIDLAANQIDLAADRIDLAANRIDLAANRIDLAANRIDLAANRIDLAANRIDLAANRIDLAANRIDLAADRIDLAANRPLQLLVRRFPTQASPFVHNALELLASSPRTRRSSRR